MKQNFNNLADLLLNCDSAKNYYNSLPTNAQVSITNNGKNITNETELKRFAKQVK